MAIHRLDASINNSTKPFDRMTKEHLKLTITMFNKNYKFCCIYQRIENQTK